MTPKQKKDIPEENIEVSTTTPPDREFRLISLDLIDDPELPMRSDMTEASVEDLVISIKQVGIIEPLVVKPVGNRFEVIAGHRRRFASTLAKIPMVPCFIRYANKEQTEMLKMHENLYRAEIKPTDEAKFFDNLIKNQKMTPTGIANLISKSISYVTDRIGILSYPDFLADALKSGEVSFSVAKEFAHIEDPKQMRDAVYYARRGGMTLEMAKKWVQDFKRSKEQPTIQEIPSTNGHADSQPVEHSAMCVYCKEGVRLIEAQVVYMHNDCLIAANKPSDSP